MVEEAADQLGLTALLERKPGQLSGGQRQRVALARAIVRRPVAFLMDEPLSNLDAKLRTQTRAELVELQRRLGTTVRLRHPRPGRGHDHGQAGWRCMNEGVLQQVGPPAEVYDRPANLFVARFIGNPPMNTMPGTVEGGTDHRAPAARSRHPSSSAGPARRGRRRRPPRAPERRRRGRCRHHREAAGGRVPRATSSCLVCDAEDGTPVIARLDPDARRPGRGDDGDAGGRHRARAPVRRRDDRAAGG